MGMAEREDVDYLALVPGHPVLRRGPHELQVGALPETALVLTDVHPGLAGVLELLDGSRSVATVQSRARQAGVGAAQLDWTLRTLRRAGLLVSGSSPRTSFPATPAPPELAGARVRMVGAGVLGRAVATALAAGGVGTLYLVDPAPVDPNLYPGSGLAATQAGALRQVLGTQTGNSTVVLNHWSKPDGVPCALTVVAADTPEPDRVIADDLVRSDQPHLVVSPVAGGVVLGPLVVPGHSPCLRCLDLIRRDADPSWPTLLRQLSRTSCAVEPAIAAWVGTTAAVHVLAFLRGHAPESYGATLQLTPPSYRVERRVWRAHPSCGCSWGVAAEWSP